MKNLPKTQVHLANLLHSCIDLSDYPKGSTLKGIIEAETGKPLHLSTVEKWLRGLPPACKIPFENEEIQAILDNIGNKNWSIDNYWRWSAGRIEAFAKAPKAYE